MAAVTTGGISEEDCKPLSELCEQIVCGKGILVTDESAEAISEMFSWIDLKNEEEYRRLFRQLLYSSHGLEENISLVFMTEEAFFQSDDEAEEFVQLLKRRDILVGVRVDKGPYGGLDGLASRVEGFKDRGACALRWRGLFRPRANNETVAMNMARFAALSQAKGMLPVVTAELLADGEHSLADACRELALALAAIMKCLNDLNVSLDGLLLAVPLLRAGYDLGAPLDPQESALATVSVLCSTLPPCLGGVLFMSSGFSEDMATRTLYNISKTRGRTVPWRMAFSFGRALQASPLKLWGGKLTNVSAAQEELLKRAAFNCAALRGDYQSEFVEGAAQHDDLFIRNYIRDSTVWIIRRLFGLL